MGYVKKFFVVCLIMLLAGCSTLGRKDKIFEEGYRMGVKENMSDFTKNFHGNDFPYFYWESPIVQDVHIPASIENGVFIPSHNEPVVIMPAEWRNKFTYPVSCREAKKEPNNKKEGESYEVKNISFSARDITVLPKSFICDRPGAKDKDPN